MALKLMGHTRYAFSLRCFGCPVAGRARDKEQAKSWR